MKIKKVYRIPLLALSFYFLFPSFSSYKTQELGNKNPVLPDNKKGYFSKNAKYKEEIFYDEKNRIVSKKKFAIPEDKDSDLLPLKNNGGIHEIRYQYDADGNKILEEFLDENGNRKEYEYNGVQEYYEGYALYKGIAWISWRKESGLEIEEYFDAKGKQKINGFGHFRTIRKWDASGNKLMEEFRDENNSLVSFKYHWSDNRDVARIVWEYNEKKQKILEKNYGTDEKLIGRKKGIAKKIWNYDAKGNLLSEAHFDSKGNPIKSN